MSGYLAEDTGTTKDIIATNKLTIAYYGNSPGSLSGDPHADKTNFV